MSLKKNCHFHSHLAVPHFSSVLIVIKVDKIWVDHLPVGGSRCTRTHIRIKHAVTIIKYLMCGHERYINYIFGIQ